jgi:ketosteroid isomerase-like protein
MSRHTQTPAERFTAGMQAFSEDNPQGWLDQCADDVVLEIPFAPPGFPHRVEGTTCTRASTREPRSSR